MGWIKKFRSSERLLLTDQENENRRNDTNVTGLYWADGNSYGKLIVTTKCTLFYNTNK